MPFPLNLLVGRMGYMLMAILAGGSAIASIVMTQVLHLHPCPLCILQRFFALLVCLIAVIALIWPLRLFAALVAVVSAGGLVAAIHQSQLQAKPINALSGCSFGQVDVVEKFANWLGSLSPALFKVSGICSSKEWAIGGFSLANLSAILFGALLAWAVIIWASKKIFKS